MLIMMTTELSYHGHHGHDQTATPASQLPFQIFMRLSHCDCECVMRPQTGTTVNGRKTSSMSIFFLFLYVFKSKIMHMEADTPCIRANCACAVCIQINIISCVMEGVRNGELHARTHGIWSSQHHRTSLSLAVASVYSMRFLRNGATVSPSVRMEMRENWICIQLQATVHVWNAQRCKGFN